MKKKTITIITVIALIFLAVIIYSIMNKTKDGKQITKTESNIPVNKQENNNNFKNNSEIKIKGKMELLTTETFKQKVFNYEINKEWKFEGDKPCIIDFYADWCGPCKMVAPILSELADEYEGKIDIYKVDTDAEQELAGAFGIRSIPSILFIPKTGQPQMSTGAMPKESFQKAIKNFLLVGQN
jgi:thioredoxin